MTARRLCRPLLLVLTATLASPACYTLIKHPRVETATYEEVQDNRCTSCHSDDEIWGYHHPPAQRVYSLGQDGSWEYYYAVPWWYDSYWYFVPSESGTPPLHGRDLRPGTEKGSIDGATGGPIGNTPDVKSTGGSVRTRDSDDSGKAKSDEKSEDRSVRPKGDKGKNEGQQKQKDGDKGKKAS
jgi:hypothetical protein